MSDDWQVGDKALCIASGMQTREGVIYHVIHVQRPGEECPVGGLPNLNDVEILSFAEFGISPFQGSGASRFRKIRPDKHEACEEEFLTLLNRKRVEA